MENFVRIFCFVQNNIKEIKTTRKKKRSQIKFKSKNEYFSSLWGRLCPSSGWSGCRSWHRNCPAPSTTQSTDHGSSHPTPRGLGPLALRRGGGGVAGPFPRGAPPAFLPSSGSGGGPPPPPPATGASHRRRTLAPDVRACAGMEVFPPPSRGTPR